MGTPGHLAILSVVVGAASAVVYLASKHGRKSPAEREKRRRTAVNANGRLIDGVVTEVRDHTVFYSYSWRGIEYDTAQPIDGLEVFLPHDLARLVGPVTVKFLSANPYNSIVLCESWSGFRKQKTELKENS